MARNSAFDWHFSSGWQQMAIKNTVSSNFLSAFDSINIFDCHLPGVVQRLLSLVSYELTTCERFSLSFDHIKLDFITFKVNIYFNEKCFAATDYLHFPMKITSKFLLYIISHIIIYYSVPRNKLFRV